MQIGHHQCVKIHCKFGIGVEIEAIMISMMKIGLR